MIKRFARLSIKQIVLIIITAAALLIFLLLTLLAGHLKTRLADQQAAARWAADGSAGQISCFFAEGAGVDSMQIRAFRNYIETGLKEASIEAANEHARIYADAYSSQGTLEIGSQKGKVEVNAIGVGGDFFLFHPLKLLEGGYFSGNDLMQDAIVIDEDAAWQLFGSNDVAGMSVMIGGIPHYVAGVIRKDEGRMWEAAGLTGMTAYVSEQTLAAYGRTSGIDTYEAVMPNPVKGFAYDLVKQKFGYDEYTMEVVDNTSRYAVEPLVTVMAGFGTRSMQNYAIHYPYWENYARGYEDILALVVAGQLLFLLAAAGIVIIVLIQSYRHRTWNIKDVWNYLLAVKDKIREHTKREKDKWEHF